MGQGKRRFVTPDFKAQAVKLVTEGKPPISQIAADLGIGESAAAPPAARPRGASSPIIGWFSRRGGQDFHGRRGPPPATRK